MTNPLGFLKQKDMKRIQAAAGPIERLVNLSALVEVHYELVKPILYCHAPFIDKVRFEGAMKALHEEIQAQLAEHRKENKHE